MCFCSPNTPRNTANVISAILGYPLAQDLGRYLGVPILHERTSTETYQGIVDRISQKLSGCKVKSLSLAGRVTLAQSVLASIPAYSMQTTVIPITTCDAIDRIIRNFVWGSTDEARKVHLIAWDRICTPKEDGWLGLKMARLLNRAYMMKLAFIFFQDQDRLWVRVLQGKYFTESADGLIPHNLRSQSVLWKGLSREWNSMLIGARSAIRNGRDTPFWTSRWVDSGIRLIDAATNMHPNINLADNVVDFVNEDVQWDVDKLSIALPPDVVDSVIGMSPPREDAGEDGCVWGAEDNGRFTVKSAYRIACAIPVAPIQVCG
ncbi:Putative ribonuclease H protein At1g65750 [Linum perenne]